MKSVVSIFLPLVLLAVACVSAQEIDDPEWVERAVSQTLMSFDPDAVLVVGELHGTEETPVMVRALAQRLAEDGAVVVGLEIPRQEQRRIDEFLESDGSEQAAAALLEGAFWQVDATSSDGRRSQAMARFLDEVRVARTAGALIAVATLDDEAFFEEDADRRQGMARRIEELAEDDAYDSVIVLVGNYHARLALPDRLTSDGVVLSDPPVPTAARIASVPVMAVNVSACSGSHWACLVRDACGPVRINAQCDVDEFPVVQETAPARFGYHLSITLEAFTPSPPVR